jgi:hypothetical protein
MKGSARHELAHDLKQPLTNKNKRFPQLAVLAANVRGKKPANDSQRRTVYHFVYHGDREFRLRSVSTAFGAKTKPADLAGFGG